MQKLQCELCQGIDIVKDGEFFVCQSCGCKYTIEEARKMMQVTGTVKVDRSDSIQGFIDLAESAIASGNGESAIEFANKALEIDPKSSAAWMTKSKAIQFASTYGNLRIPEMVEAGKNAIQFADGETRGTIEEDIYRYYLTRALEMLVDATMKFSDTAEIRDTFKRLALVSALTAAQNTLKIDSNLINLYEKLNSESAALTTFVPDEALVQYSGFANLLAACAKQYRAATKALISRYSIYGAKLTPAASQAREEKAAAMDERAKKAKDAILDKLLQTDPAAGNKLQAAKSKVDSIEQEIKSLENERDNLSFFKMNKKTDLNIAIEGKQRELMDAKKAYDQVLDDLTSGESLS